MLPLVSTPRRYPYAHEQFCNGTPRSCFSSTIQSFPQRIMYTELAPRKHTGAFPFPDIPPPFHHQKPSPPAQCHPAHAVHMCAGTPLPVQRIKRTDHRGEHQQETLLFDSLMLFYRSYRPATRGRNKAPSLRPYGPTALVTATSPLSSRACPANRTPG